jgi:hypothetical protein
MKNMKKILAVLMSSLVTTITAIVPFAFADSIKKLLKSTTATVDKAMSATFNYNTVAWGSLTESTSDNAPTPDSTGGQYNVTVDTNVLRGNSVNLDYLYKVTAQVTTEMNDGAGHTISAGNQKMAVNETAGSLTTADSTTLTTGVQDIEINIPETVTTSYNGWWLSIPADQFANA